MINNKRILLFTVGMTVFLLASCENMKTNAIVDNNKKKQEAFQDGYTISICQNGFGQSVHSDSIVYKYDSKRICIDNRKYTYSKLSSNGRYYYPTGSINEEIIIEKSLKINYSDTLLLDDKIIFIDSLNLNSFIISLGTPDYIKYLVEQSNSYTYDSLQEILTLDLNQKLSIVGMRNVYNVNGNSINVKKVIFFFNNRKLIKSIIYIEDKMVITRHFFYESSLLIHYFKEVEYVKEWGYKKAGKFKSDEYWIYVRGY